ncbi:MAG: efflux RND transporter periplasmic adaptor subunit [Spongiibacteraceae bacterium]|nr:efflux RND transporter periplasmic adaptor subunit [Spongiibacteraceae bacterium]
MSVFRSRVALATLFLVLLAAVWYGWWSWRGPLLPGYRLTAQPLVQRVVASGEVANRSLAQVGSEIVGTVAARHVREGDEVEVGDLLLTLRDDEQRARLREAQAALDELRQSRRPQAEASLKDAEARLQQAERELARREALFERGLLSEEQLDAARRAQQSAAATVAQTRVAAAAVAPGGSAELAAEQRVAAAQAALERTQIRAQVAGQINSRHVEPGDLVQPGRTLMTLARRDQREILLPLDEKNLAPLAPGQPAVVIADAYPEQLVMARVDYLAPGVDVTRGTLDVHLELLDEAPFLRTGMTVSVNIETGRRERALVIPNDALFHRTGSRAMTYRVVDGRVEAVPVELGLRGTALSEVRGGLTEGDLVLASSVPAGERVRVAARPVPELDR